MKKAVILILALAFIASAHAASWSGNVNTNTTSWTINRESATIGFDMSGSVEGNISSIVGPGGRVLSPYHSYYADVDMNDVRLRERTGALEGQYSAEEVMRLRAETEKAVNITATKPAGSNVWTITWYETWPVTLNASRTIDYTGKEINNRDCVGNNLDSVGATFLYNKEFSKERTVGLKLDRMNATVVATNDTIIRADVMPTRSTDYGLESHSTGIADLRYRQTYPDETVQNSGVERYCGTYDIKRNIVMRSVYAEEVNETDWLSCCLEGCYGMDPVNSGWWSESEVFDCVCS